MTAKTKAREPIVREIDPELIDHSAENPRGDTPEDIESDPDFARLQDSVLLYGVMVPLVVTESETRPGRFVLIDGERRWRAALSVNAKLVPVRVVTGDPGDALAQSFHIHSLRKEWSPAAYAAATQTLIRQLKSEEPGIGNSEGTIRKRVSERTGLSGMDLRRAVRIALRYSAKDIQAMRRGDPEISYVSETEERFIDEVNRRFPRLLRRLGEQKARRTMVGKARRGLLGDTQGLRPLGKLIAAVLEKPQRAFLEKEIEQFLADDEMAVADVLRSFHDRFPQGTDDALALAENVNADAKTLKAALRKLDLSDLKERYAATASALVRTLRLLHRVIDGIITSARR
jgi:ParB/RepB/Spo0J family partition protein